jgi:hypothetical protein
MTENQGTLRKVDQTTAATTTAANLGINSIIGLSNRPGDTTYIYGTYGDELVFAPSRLVKINTITGESTSFPLFDELILGIPNPTGYGLAISPNTPNIAVVSGFSQNSANRYYLWKVDVDTGLVLGAAIPTTELVNELAYSPDGSVLYGVNSNGQLVTVNSDTGSVTLVGDPGLSNFIEGLAFRPSDGALFAIDGDLQDRLVRLDPSNGSLLEVVGNLNVVGPNGLAFIPGHQLSVNKSGTGSGRVTSAPAGINCGSTCSYVFNANTNVTLTAAADAGYTFTGWSGGGCAGTGTCTINMTSATSVIATFTGLPGKATLVGPADAISTDQPTYIWNEVSGSTWYYLWVDGPSGNILQQWYTSEQANCNGTTCSIANTTLGLDGGVYTWWVQTWNEAGFGPWSDGMTFSPTPPGKAMLSSPNTAITDSTPLYEWQAVEGASWYYLWVNNAAGNVIKQWYKAIDVCNNRICAVEDPTVLSGGTHTWWIQTWNEAGVGPWSEAMSFSLPVPTAPGKATLVSPTGNSGTNMPMYTWNEVSDSTWYYLWINDGSGNVYKKWYIAADAHCNGTTCWVTPATTLSSGAHTWWIQTWNEAGIGPWSKGGSFSVP